MHILSIFSCTNGRAASSTVHQNSCERDYTYYSAPYVNPTQAPGRSARMSLLWTNPEVFLMQQGLFVRHNRLPIQLAGEAGRRARYSSTEFIVYYK